MISNIIMEPHRCAPLGVWESLEYRLPGPVAIARDLLYIPMAGVGVGRIFNLVRDFAYYPHEQLKPDTIRAILLVYCHQGSKLRRDTTQTELSQTIDIRSMTDKEIEIEIQQCEMGCNIWVREVDSWNQDHFIGDTEENIPPRTLRIEL